MYHKSFSVTRKKTMRKASEKRTAGAIRFSYDHSLHRIGLYVIQCIFKEINSYIAMPLSILFIA